MGKQSLSDIMCIGLVLHVLSGSVLCKKVADVIDRACLPEGTDRLVYRYQNNSHVMVGFDLIKKDKLYSMTWQQTADNADLLEMRSSNGYDVLRGGDYRNDFSHHTILAATNNRGQNEFKRHVDSCQGPQIPMECLREALATTALRMKEVKFGDNCIGTLLYRK